MNVGVFEHHQGPLGTKQGESRPQRIRRKPVRFLTDIIIDENLLLARNENEKTRKSKGKPKKIVGQFKDKPTISKENLMNNQPNHDYPRESCLAANSNESNTKSKHKVGRGKKNKDKSKKNDEPDTTKKSDAGNDGVFQILEFSQQFEEDLPESCSDKNLPSCKPVEQLETIKNKLHSKGNSIVNTASKVAKRRNLTGGDSAFETINNANNTDSGTIRRSPPNKSEKDKQNADVAAMANFDHAGGANESNARIKKKVARPNKITDTSKKRDEVLQVAEFSQQLEEGFLGRVSKAEKERRRNLKLSKILQPKNAVMILNELVKGCQYTIDELPCKIDANQFRASVSFEEQEFAGTGRTKTAAKNSAAETALKCLVKNKRLSFKKEASDSSEAGEGADEKMEIGEEYGTQVMPWSHIASFAIYKLFSTWGEEPTTTNRAQELSSPIPKAVGAVQTGRTESKPAKKMPDNPEKINPLMLMNLMLPHAQWEEVEKSSLVPNVVFTFNVTVDGKQFTGTGRVSKAEKERRRNLKLSKILQPKNAVMILNQLVKGCQHTIDELPCKIDANQFRASVSFEEQEFAGTAKNSAAETALKYLVKNKRLSFKKEASDSGEAGEGADEKMEIGEEYGTQVMPWSHIASFAMYKLFSTWGEEPTTTNRAQELSSPIPKAVGTVQTERTESKPAKKMPDNPEKINPLMLMNLMLPHAQWEEVEKSSLVPNVVFTFNVTVDGKQFTGTGTNKKSAKKLAAFAACHQILNINYPDDVWVPLY